MRWLIHRAVVVVLGLAVAGMADAQSRPRRQPIFDAAAFKFSKTPSQTLTKAAPPSPAAPSGAESAAFRQQLADAVNRSAPVADADLSVLGFTMRKLNGRTFMIAVVRCEPLRNSAGGRTLTFYRSFQRAPTNPEAARNSGLIDFLENLAVFRVSSLRAGETREFAFDATRFVGEELTATLSPGDRNRDNDSRSVTVPVR
jgi:hypothetical protein